MLEMQRSTLDLAGAARLEQIRASLSGDQLTSGTQKPAVEAAKPNPADTTAARLEEIRASLAEEQTRGQGDTTAAT